MKIKIDSDVLASCIKALLRMVQAQTVSFEVKGGILHVTGTGNGNSCRMTVPCEPESKKGTAAFSIDANVFLTAISKRKTIELTITDTAVEITSARYKAELLITQFESIEVVPEDVKAEKNFKLKDKFLKVIRESMPKIELQPLLAMIDFVPIGIRATKKGTTIACFDAFQTSYLHLPELTGDFEFTLPSNLFSMIAREIKDQDYVMAVTDSTIYAYNDMFEMALARPQQEGGEVTLDQVVGLFDSLKGNKGFTKIVMKSEGIRALLANGKAIYEKDATFSFKSKGDKCQLHLKSSYGQAQGLIKLDEEPKGAVDFTCDFKFFAALLEKAPATIELRVGKEMLLFKNGEVTYLLSLV